jgi:hypothetical protein
MTHKTDQDGRRAGVFGLFEERWEAVGLEVDPGVSAAYSQR